MAATKQIKNPFIKSSAKKKHLKIAVYGPPGVGKTYFGLGFPSPAVIDLEGGTDFYADRFQFSVLDTKSFADVLEAVEFLETGQHDFKTLVIDPITIIWSSLQDGRLEFKTKDVNKAVAGEEASNFNALDWGQLKRFYSMLMTKLVNLDMHVVMVGRQKDEYDIKKGGEMIKTGVKIDGEKSTTYLPDICFRLNVDESGKRIAIFEKDRSGTFRIGQIVKGISFESFSSLVEKSSQGESVATHQSEEDAIGKDAAFFQERETKPAERPFRDNSNKGINAPTLQNIFTWFGALGFHKDFELRYKLYCYSKYGVDSMTKLAVEQIQEQLTILSNAKNIEANKQKFFEHLSGYEIPELAHVDIEHKEELINQKEQPRKPAGNGKEHALRIQIKAKLRSYYRGDDNKMAEYFIKELPSGKNGIDEMSIEELTVMNGNIKVLIESGNGDRQGTIV